MVIYGLEEIKGYLNHINAREEEFAIMTRLTSLSQKPLPLFAMAGSKAQIIRQGPTDVLWPSEIEGDPPAYGWANLSLEARYVPHLIESRSVYANLFDDTQRFAVLRAVFWDGKSIKKAVTQKEETFKLALPTRFVKVPIERLKEWLSQFDNISCVITEPLTPEDSDTLVPVRKLRIEQDYVCNIFEKAWESEDANYQTLNQKWNNVWTDMSKALSSESILDYVDENFQCINFDITYDFDTYRPNNFSF